MGGSRDSGQGHTEGHLVGGEEPGLVPEVELGLAMEANPLTKAGLSSTLDGELVWTRL